MSAGEPGWISTDTVTSADVRQMLTHEYREPDTIGAGASSDFDSTQPTAGWTHPAVPRPPFPKYISNLTRWYGSHDAPPGATVGRLRADLYVRRHQDAADPFIVMEVRRGTWGAGAIPPAPYASWDDFSETLFAQSVPAYWDAGVGGDEDWLPYPIDVEIPVVDGRVQWVFKTPDDLGWTASVPEQHSAYLFAPGADRGSDTQKYHLEWFNTINPVTGPCDCDPWQPTILGTATTNPGTGKHTTMSYGYDGTVEGTPGNVPATQTGGWPLFRVGTAWLPAPVTDGWLVQTTYNEVSVPTGCTRVRIEEVVTTGGWNGPGDSTAPGSPFYTFFARRHDWGPTLSLAEADSSLGEIFQEFTVPNLNGAADEYTFPGVTMPLAIEFDLYPGQTTAQWSFWPRSDYYAVPFLLTRDVSSPFLVTFYGPTGGSGGPTGPMNNQPIEDEDKGVGNGVSTTFTTAYPYVASSLEVTVDGIPVPADQTDPLTGTFDIGFAPEIDEVVKVSYRYQEPV